MKLQIFSVYDEKAAVFGTPIFLSHKGIAVREFSDIALDKNSAIGKHPGDYKLMLLGDFDNVSGMFSGLPIPELVCTAIEFTNNI